jgi:kinesin family protein 6/9
MEDEDNNIHLKNLSVHAATNEEEALNLLFLGDTNRMIAEVRHILDIIEIEIS